ncbi:unnamed protein product [Parnassius apollo]|uniref:(apollo) hypothetical protein n=1 Tax=Parnassius apollo TaxID=110799 RepID=A0A8S3WHU3_PARAO|nr:unnamed protein product [Parnassius apollo]
MEVDLNDRDQGLLRNDLELSGIPEESGETFGSGMCLQAWDPLKERELVTCMQVWDIREDAASPPHPSPCG